MKRAGAAIRNQLASVILLFGQARRLCSQQAQVIAQDLHRGFICLDLQQQQHVSDFLGGELLC